MYKILMVPCFILFLFFPYAINANELYEKLSIGIVRSDNAGIQVSTTKDSLRGDIILICSPVKVVCTPVLSDLFSAGKPNEVVEDVATGKNIHTYYYNVALDNKLQSAIDIAVILPKENSKTFTFKFDEKHRLLINYNSLKDVISSCASHEGVHIYSKSGDVHWYYALGYELMANCSDEVYK